MFDVLLLAAAEAISPTPPPTARAVAEYRLLRRLVATFGDRVALAGGRAVALLRGNQLFANGDLRRAAEGLDLRIVGTDLEQARRKLEAVLQRNDHHDGLEVRRMHVHRDGGGKRDKAASGYLEFHARIHEWPHLADARCARSASILLRWELVPSLEGFAAPMWIQGPALFDQPVPMPIIRPEAIVAEAVEELARKGTDKVRPRQLLPAWSLLHLVDQRLLPLVLLSTFHRRGTIIPTRLPTLSSYNTLDGWISETTWSVGSSGSRTAQPSRHQVIAALRRVVDPALGTLGEFRRAGENLRRQQSIPGALAPSSSQPRGR